MGSDKLETVGIKALRDAISSYLHKVSLGVRVLVSDRGRIIAEISSPNLDNLPNNTHPKLQNWLNKEVCKLGRSKRTRINPTGVKLKDITSQDLLDQERDSR